MDSIERLTQLFEKFPGIGPRQARRFVHYLLSERQAARLDLSQAIRDLGQHTAQCRECYRWFVKTDPAKEVLCGICGNPARDRATLFIVEKDADIENIERSGFKGLYFCLGGTIPLASEEIPRYVRVHELVSRIDRDGSAAALKEIILGLSATTEGDHTRLLLQEKLLPMSEGFNFKITSLGRGLSTGSELEYADPDTIQNALKTRA
ncbi:MAG TPA: toprim domain-containing protein [Candidatus Paceibacterota bacterium]|nr:toprim domain-containing protein [Candidatus Paceibacterota bacterium]